MVTGKLLWVFHTIPRPGEFGYDTWPKDAYKYMGGVDVWGEITVDEKRGIVYFPVRRPSTSFMAETGQATIFTPIVCSRWTPARVSSSGITRRFTTMSGITIQIPPRSW